MPNFFVYNYEVQKQSNNSSKTVKKFVKMQHDHCQRLSSYKKQQFSWKKCHLFKNLPSSVNFLFYLFILVTPFLYNVIIYYLHHQCWFTTVKNPCLTWFQPRRGFILFSLYSCWDKLCSEMGSRVATATFLWSSCSLSLACCESMSLEKLSDSEESRP